MKYRLSFTLNGETVEVLAKPTDTLLDILREDIHVMSPKRGCDTGDCGACTVLIDGEPILACLTIALTVSGKDVKTVESLISKDGSLHPLQESFHEHYAAQCGFCTPGMLLSSKALLDNNSEPSREDVIEAISGHICRCGTYHEVIDAVQAVAKDDRKE
jgi:carbon-monoxide dehydrogenase small subunit